ncbi:hypothetical protein N7U66_18880 [Lacinutrix neustonica]|uniref:Uncharacterized protein n=1 Tax=Lacinutrix neustonica TaxID=2980107 RepID=A0A9E8MUP2_9FLAO|nr:hypothetical protein [Lacinutrix neustonica]WAC01897.1 hypothetical protein N7U66_18880 [Lacinutrix neustonica]
MIKRYSFFAKWRKKDVIFLNNLNINKTITEGYDGFWIENKDTYIKIIDHFSKKNSLFEKTEPPKFSTSLIGVSFSKKELDEAKYYNLVGTGTPKGYPQPKEGYKKIVFTSECGNYRVNRKQIAPFRINKPKWNINQVNFSMEWEWDCMFFKKEFYPEVLAPLGIMSREVLLHSTGKPIEDTIQLDIPIAESKLLIENSEYDVYTPEQSCGKKQYSQQNLDFFPPFEKEFDFHICYTQEEFYGGFKRIIISKELCQILVKHQVIKYHSAHLIPMKSI